MAVVSGFVVSPGCVAGRMSSNAPAAVPETTDRPEPAHLVIPPATEYASKPTLRRKPVIGALRLPVAHTTYTGASLSSSEVRPGNWSIGMSTAPGTCPATYSRGSRTSMIVASAIAASANWLMSISGLSAGITCVLLAVGVRYPSGYTNLTSGHPWGYSSPEASPVSGPPTWTNTAPAARRRWSRIYTPQGILVLYVQHGSWLQAWAP